MLPRQPAASLWIIEHHQRAALDLHRLQRVLFCATTLASRKPANSANNTDTALKVGAAIAALWIAGWIRERTCSQLYQAADHTKQEHE